MNIQTSTLKTHNRFQPASTKPQAAQAEAAPPSDAVTLSTANDLKALAVGGGISLVGAALGAAAGNYSGALAGLAGAVVGAAAGTSAAVHMPGEKIGMGAIVGAVGGAVVASSFGNTGLAVGMGLAGLTLPYGAIIGLASGWS